jgi:hypothetical protein
MNVEILVQWAAAWRGGDERCARSGLDTADTTYKQVNVEYRFNRGYEPSPDANNTLIPAYNSATVETVLKMY